MLLAVAGFGLATIAFGCSGWFWFSFLMLFICGGLDNISVIVRHTLVQLLTPDEKRGRRGVLWRPGPVGGLAGLAAGLIADASWRTVCNVAEPSHVLTAHFGGIVALAIIGAVTAKVYAWLSGAR